MESVRNVNYGKNMSKLLVIANLHHASPRIPGLLYPLADMGWEATVVTPDVERNSDELLGFPRDFREKVRIAEAPYRGDIFWIYREILDKLGFSKGRSYTEQIKEKVGEEERGGSLVDKLMSLYQSIFAIPDTEWPWYRSALRRSRDLFAEGAPFDVMISSSPFPTVHRVAARLKAETGIPWIADFRDPWSQSHNYTMPRYRYLIDRYLEKSTIAPADMVSTVSVAVAEKLSQLHGERVVVVPNGYQPVVDDHALEMPERLTISYTGTIYQGKQDPNLILAAMKELIEEGRIDGSRVALNFYGRYNNALQNRITELGLEKSVRQMGSLPRAEIRRCQRNSHILLLLQWEDRNERGIFPLKFYEYLDASRPIIATGGDRESDLADIIADTGSGWVAETVPEIKRLLAGAYDEFYAAGFLEYHGNAEAIEKYSFNGCAKKLSVYLDEVVKKGNKR